MSSVFSIEPEGMTRAWPRVPLMSKKARITQNQAMISLLTLAPIVGSGALAALFFGFVLAASAFTIHLGRSIHPSIYCRAYWRFGARFRSACRPAPTFVRPLRSQPLRVPRGGSNARGWSSFPLDRYCFDRAHSIRSVFADFELHQVRGVDTRITGSTELAFGVADGFSKAREREIAKGISAEVLADLLGRVRGGDELFLCRSVHAVVAGRDCWRTTDAHVNFTGSGFPHHADELATGGAAHDGIVHKHNALSPDEFADGIELEFHAEIANRL